MHESHGRDQAGWTTGREGDGATPGGMPQPRTDPADTGADDPLAAVPDSAEGALHAPGGTDPATPDDGDASTGGVRRGAGDGRDDPPSRHVPGRHDAGARGRDRDSGGWGDRGIGGGRAGGTGL